jgi:hypothetical protein
MLRVKKKYKHLYTWLHKVFLRNNQHKFVSNNQVLNLKKQNYNILKKKKLKRKKAVIPPKERNKFIPRWWEWVKTGNSIISVFDFLRDWFE